MGNYEELIENFRSVKEDEEINIYGNVLHEIADAIEQLVKERDALRKELENDKRA